MKSQSLENLARRTPRWFTPNLLTAARLILIVPLSLTVLFGKYQVALIIFIIIAFTEIDGFVARAKNLVSEKGSILDAGVDKIGLIPVLMLIWRHISHILFWGTLLVAFLHLVGVLIIKAFEIKVEIRSNLYGRLSGFLQAISVMIILLNPSSILAIVCLSLALILAAFSLILHSIKTFKTV